MQKKTIKFFYQVLFEQSCYFGEQALNIYGRDFFVGRKFDFGLILKIGLTAGIIIEIVVDFC